MPKVLHISMAFHGCIYIILYLYLIYVYIYMCVCVMGVYIYDIKKSKQDVAEHVAITLNPM
jgi:hypothetical protein